MPNKDLSRAGMPTETGQSCPPAFFPARLAPRQLLLSRTLGYGAGILLPALIGLFIAAVYGEYWALLLPIPFLFVLAIADAFRPRGFLIDTDSIAVVRRIGPVIWSLPELAILRAPPQWSGNKPVAVLATRGLFGTYGWFWNRDWGMHRIYITDPAEAVEIELINGRRIVITPSSHREFVATLREAAKSAGISLRIEK
jgi:hypothetical protein